MFSPRVSISKCVRLCLHMTGAVTADRQIRVSCPNVLSAKSGCSALYVTHIIRVGCIHMPLSNHVHHVKWVGVPKC